MSSPSVLMLIAVLCDGDPLDEVAGTLKALKAPGTIGGTGSYDLSVEVNAEVGNICEMLYLPEVAEAVAQTSGTNGKHVLLAMHVAADPDPASTVRALAAYAAPKTRPSIRPIALDDADEIDLLVDVMEAQSFGWEPVARSVRDAQAAFAS